eukprot:Sspe_Gene.26917::Locus_11367_Transcript_7_10_Confidence_0.212_Length_602::g.26917::m.26917
MRRWEHLTTEIDVTPPHPTPPTHPPKNKSPLSSLSFTHTHFPSSPLYHPRRASQQRCFPLNARPIKPSPPSCAVFPLFVPPCHHPGGESYGRALGGVGKRPYAPCLRGEVMTPSSSPSSYSYRIPG